jgi:hypothetical protein
MTKELVTAADIPTHKLTVKTEDGRFKVFYVSEKQAIVLRAGINGNDKFICLSKDVDKDAPSFYPKWGACLEKISREEAESRMRRYENTVSSVIDEQKEQAKKFESEKVDAWIQQNPEAWEQKRKDAFVKLKSGNMFSGASEVVQSVLIRMEARRIVHAEITKPTS